MTIGETTIMQMLDFWVDGTPKPQGSKRAFVNPKTRRAIVVDVNSGALRDWRTDVSWRAREAMSGKRMIVQPAGVVLGIEFVLPRPTATPKTRPTPLAVKKPDVDKLLRAIMDALTGVAYADDSQVIGFERLRKRVAEIGESPGAHITVYEERIV